MVYTLFILLAKLFNLNTRFGKIRRLMTVITEKQKFLTPRSDLVKRLITVITEKWNSLFEI